MFQIISRSIQKITPSTAKHLLDQNNYKSQRGLSERHVKNLANAINSGLFLTGSIALAKNGDGRQYLMNGQHQLNAVIATGKPIEAIVEHAECPTPADMSQYFAQFDNGRIRSIKNIVDAEVGSMGVKWHSRTGNLMATALTILFGAESSSRYERAKMVRNHQAEGDFVNQFITNSTKHLCVGAVVASMIVTFLKNKKDAQTFWQGVAHGEMLTKSDPRNTLRTYLLSIPSMNQRAKNRNIRAKCIIAWNAWRSNRTTSLRYDETKPIPAVK